MEDSNSRTSFVLKIPEYVSLNFWIPHWWAQRNLDICLFSLRAARVIAVTVAYSRTGYVNPRRRGILIGPKPLIFGQMAIAIGRRHSRSKLIRCKCCAFWLTCCLPPNYPSLVLCWCDISLSNRKSRAAQGPKVDESKLKSICEGTLQCFTLGHAFLLI